MAIVSDCCNVCTDLPGVVVPSQLIIKLMAAFHQKAIKIFEHTIQARSRVPALVLPVVGAYGHSVRNYFAARSVSDM